MAYSLPLPKRLADKGWKAKIRDRERLEPPHVTVMWKTFRWRWNLRACAFMDREPEPRDVPQELVEVLRVSLESLRQKWDEMYPENPVASHEDSDE